jgi:hypothetical protein
MSRPAIRAGCEQPHRIDVAAHLKAVAVVLDLVHPIRTGRRLGGARRYAGWDESWKHGTPNVLPRGTGPQCGPFEMLLAAQNIKFC